VEWEDFIADYWGVSSAPHASTMTAAREDTDMSPCEMELELDDKRLLAGGNDGSCHALSGIRTGCMDIDMDVGE
jgi:hypothetical protein